MSSLVIAGDTSGTVTLQAPAIAGSTILTLPVSTDTLIGQATTDTLTNKTLNSPVISGSPSGVGVLTSGTVATLTSQTSVDFTGIPNWAKRITVMFGNISSSGTSVFQIIVNSEVTGYTSAVARITPVNFSSGGSSTTGWTMTTGNNAASFYSGIATIYLLNPSTNQYSISGNMNQNDGASSLNHFSGTKTLASVLSTVRVTTVNGTDTFDSGTINILWE